MAELILSALWPTAAWFFSLLFDILALRAKISNNKNDEVPAAAGRYPLGVP
jgi:hypothetical protein